MRQFILARSRRRPRGGRNRRLARQRGRSRRCRSAAACRSRPTRPSSKCPRRGAAALRGCSAQRATWSRSARRWSSSPKAPKKIPARSSASSTAAKNTARTATAPASRRGEAGAGRCPRCGRSRASSMSISISVQASGPGGTITRADVERARKSLDGGRAGRAAARACGARWRSAWRRRMPKSCQPRSPTRPISSDWTQGRRHHDPAGARHRRGLQGGAVAQRLVQCPGRRSAGSSNASISASRSTPKAACIVPVLRNVGERDAHDLRAGLDRMRADAARAIDPAGGAARRHHHAVEFRHDRRALCQSRRGAAAGRDRRSRPRCASACWRISGQPAVRRVLPLSLTFDHRVVTGGEAARFLWRSRRISSASHRAWLIEFAMPDRISSGGISPGSRTSSAQSCF